MDNMIFDIRGDRKHLKAALDYLQTIAKPECYAIVPRKGLVLFWYKNSKTTRLSFGSISKSLTFEVETNKFDIDWKVFVGSWVMDANRNDFELDDFEIAYDGGDVSIGPGFRINCEGWGHVGKNHYAFALVKPIFAWYGK